MWVHVSQIYHFASIDWNSTRNDIIAIDSEWADKCVRIVALQWNDAQNVHNIHIELAQRPVPLCFLFCFDMERQF